MNYKIDSQLSQLEAQRERIIQTIVNNYVSAGDITPTNQAMAEMCRTLTMDRLVAVLVESAKAREERGIPLVYRLNGIRG